MFDEALRLFPLAWLVTRKAVQDDVLNGVAIPSGSIIVVSITNVQKITQFWEKPLVFDPDRFIPEQSNHRPKFAYMPYGGNPRLCIGNYFALLEGPLVLASIYQKYRLKLNPGQKMLVCRVCFPLLLLWKTSFRVLFSISICLTFLGKTEANRTSVFS